MDDLAIWYFYLKNSQIEFFDGDLTFTKQAGTSDITDETNSAPTGTIMGG